MQDIFGSVRRSLVFRSPDGVVEEVTTAGTLVDKINYRIRKSRVFSKSSPPPPMAKDESPTLRWRKGELIGCGAFGRVYMGMNLDSGELLAVKQTHVSELEEEAKLFKNLSHPNIIRYLGTVREDRTLNILLEFVPGGSISSLLGKFGSFPESNVRQAIVTGIGLSSQAWNHAQGYKDFGASKQVVELATVSGAKSMKGTPYWMAPEVILQTGHSFYADIWSVGYTVIEMATGKPPWSQQYQEVAALFYIGTTKSHPPIPEHLSHEAKDFLLKCLQKEPESRPAACELLQESSKYASASCGTNQENYAGSMDICSLGSLSCSTVNFDKLAGSSHVWGANNSGDDMCQIDDKDDFAVGREEKSSSGLKPDNFNESFNPMCEPSDDWRCKEGKNLGLDVGRTNLSKDQPGDRPAGNFPQSGKGDNILSIQCTSSISEDDDEATESNIKAFLDEKALELKKLQTPLYEEFYNSFNASCSPSLVEKARDENSPNYLKLPPKSRSPNRVPSGTPSAAVDGMNSASPGSLGRQVSDVGGTCHQGFQDTPLPQHNDQRGFLADADQEASPSFSERQKKWKEELDQELERKREMMRPACVGAKTSSPKDRALSQPRERSRFASPGK